MSDKYFDALTDVQDRCTELLTEARAERAKVAIAIEALRDIALCNNGEGYMPERAQRALGLIQVKS